MNDAARAEWKRLVVIADDLGASPAMNRGIAEAHERGIVTSASLLATGSAHEEAVEIACAHPGLSVGLHVALCDGRAVLSQSAIPDLADAYGDLEESPARAAILYWALRRRIRDQIEKEVEAQFERIESAGVRPTHVDGHHHLHMHPAVFDIVCRAAARRGVRWIRVPVEDLSDVLRCWSPLDLPGHLAEWGALEALGHRNRRTAVESKLSFASRVFGMPHGGRIDERFLAEVLSKLPPGTSEIYVHPDAESEGGRREIEVLTSPRTRELLDELGISLVGYRDLADDGMVPATGVEPVT